ncbi:hypothetical protein [Mycolicibacter minnesotensis]
MEAASQDRAAAGDALAGFQASTNARRTKILAAATTEAEEILRIAHAERIRIAEEIEEAERSRRDVYQRLAAEDERNRRAAQEALEEQIKLAWEEDEHNRREGQHRLDQKMKSARELAESNIAELDREARLEASELISNTKREVTVLTERTRAEVESLKRERTGIVNHLNEVRNWIDSAVAEDGALPDQADAPSQVDQEAARGTA